ncbi:lateral tail fiber protein [Escherichia phage PaulScherrer]|nr:lateral tail fiber protein [Escherichia phage PaulScherrer]
MSTTITNLPETSKVNGSDYLVLDQSDKTVKSTVSKFLTDTGVVLATQLKDTDGADLIQSSNGNTVQEELNNNLLNDREQWRRSLAEAGLTLVDGSFEEGATLNNNTDAVWYIAAGQCYSWDGAFPKTVAAGSTPTSSGGVGLGAWVSVGDASLRKELSSNYGAGLIKTTNGDSVQSELDTLRLSDSAEKIAANLLLGSAKVIDSVSSADSFILPSFATLEGGDNFLTGFIGTTYQKNKTIRKSSNTTVTLTNQDPTASSQTVDAVVYQDPSWPGGRVFPQKSALKHITVEGNSAANPSQAGFFVLQAGVVDIENVDFINCTYAIWAKDIWQSRISRVFSNNGKIRLDNGTSVVLTGCGLASADTGRTGAFDLTGMKYSTLIGCTSDHTTNTAYSFDACEGIVLDACGCEGANTTTANAGTALAFKDNNHNIVVNAFTCFPVADQGPALISFGSNNQVTLNSFEVIPGITYNGDIYLYGANSHITINGGRFGSSGNAMPIVIASAAAVGSTVTYHHRRGITYTYRVTEAGVVSPVQHFRPIVSAIIAASGDVVSGFGVNSVTKNSTGSYTINFTSEVATGYHIQQLSSFGFQQVSTFDNTSLTVTLISPDKIPTDSAFSININGW